LYVEKKKGFKQTAEQVRMLIKKFKQEELIDHLESDHETLEENEMHYHQKPKRDRIEEQFSFRIRIGSELVFPDFQSRSLLEEGKKEITASISVQLTQNQIRFMVKTTPLWNVYPEQFMKLRQAFESMKVGSTKWLLEQQVNCYLLDLLRLELQSSSSEHEAGISLSETIVLQPLVAANVLVLGSLDRQLLLWAHWEGFLERENRRWLGQVLRPSNEPMMSSRAEEVIKSSLLFLHSELNALGREGR
jgi:hypothetical protein